MDKNDILNNNSKENCYTFHKVYIFHLCNSICLCLLKLNFPDKECNDCGYIFRMEFGCVFRNKNRLGCNDFHGSDLYDMDLDCVFFEDKDVKLNYLKHDLGKYSILPFDACLRCS